MLEQQANKTARRCILRSLKLGWRRLVARLMTSLFPVNNDLASLAMAWPVLNTRYPHKDINRPYFTLRIITFHVQTEHKITTDSSRCLLSQIKFTDGLDLVSDPLVMMIQSDESNCFATCTSLTQVHKYLPCTNTDMRSSPPPHQLFCLTGCHQ